VGANEKTLELSELKHFQYWCRAAVDYFSKGYYNYSFPNEIRRGHCLQLLALEAPCFGYFDLILSYTPVESQIYNFICLGFPNWSVFDLTLNLIKMYDIFLEGINFGTISESQFMFLRYNLFALRHSLNSDFWYFSINNVNKLHRISHDENFSSSVLTNLCYFIPECYSHGHDCFVNNMQRLFFFLFSNHQLLLWGFPAFGVD
jgi:hypothetical protein